MRSRLLGRADALWSGLRATTTNANRDASLLLRRLRKPHEVSRDDVIEVRRRPEPLLRSVRSVREAMGCDSEKCDERLLCHGGAPWNCAKRHKGPGCRASKSPELFLRSGSKRANAPMTSWAPRGRPASSKERSGDLLGGRSLQRVELEGKRRMARFVMIRRAWTRVLLITPRSSSESFVAGSQRTGTRRNVLGRR